jgi:hypothetical protein
MSRRRFLQASAVTTAAFFAMGCQMVQPAAAPKPLPGGTQFPDPMGFLHFYLPTDTLMPDAPDIASGNGDPSTIYDFNGTTGVFEPFGGTGTDNEGNTLHWAADIRFIDGEYLDANDNRQHGTFAFI